MYIFKLLRLLNVLIILGTANENKGGLWRHTT
jgi:hypothetical protein